MRQHDFLTFFGSILGSFWVPKGVGNGAQVGPRSDPNRSQKRRCEKNLFKIVLGWSWGGLGAVLERSWAILAELKAILGRFGGGWGGRIIVFPQVVQYFLKCQLSHKSGNLGRSGGDLGASWREPGASWTELGPISAPKRSQKGRQKGPRRRPKRVQNDINFTIDFWIDLGTILEGPGGWPRR